MSFVKRMNEAREAPQKTEVDETRCFADGCPCRASMSVEGDRWMCRFHARKDPQDWPRISSGLREHDWMIGAIGDIVRLDRAGKAGRARQFAADFFGPDYPELLPAASEPLQAYIARLNAALAYMAGAAEAPPSGWSPQSLHKDFQRGRFVGSSEEVAA